MKGSGLLASAIAAVFLMSCATSLRQKDWVPPEVDDLAGSARKGPVTGSKMRDDSAALQAMLDAAESEYIQFPRERLYLVQSKLRIPADREVDFNGSTIRKTSSDASSAFQILVQTGAVVRNLTFEIPVDVMINRGFNLSAGAELHNVRVVSADQQANTRSQEHAAVNINGNGTRIDHLEVENFDSVIRCEGGSRGSAWSNITVTSYLQAFDLYDCRDFSLTDFLAHTRSPNAGTRPGHNGLTLRGAKSGRLSNIDIRDSGEHGIYVAGSQIANSDLRFVDVKVTRPGQCGLKIRNTAAKTTGISIDGLVVQDAHFGNKAGWNEDGLRIELAEGVSVTGFSLTRSNNARSSAHDGIYVSRSSKVRVFAPIIRDVANTGIRIRDEGAGSKMNDIIIESPTISGTGRGHGIEIEVSGTDSELGMVSVSNARISNTAGYAVQIDAADAAIVDEVRIAGVYQSANGGQVNNVRSNSNSLLDVRLEGSGDRK
jgi:hypothetical protein